MAAVVEISRIILRKGLEVDLPQNLEESELGYTTDTGRLFIGAPNLTNLNQRTSFPYENVEILTEVSGVKDTYLNLTITSATIATTVTGVVTTFSKPHWTEKVWFLDYSVKRPAVAGYSGRLNLHSNSDSSDMSLNGDTTPTAGLTFALDNYALTGTVVNPTVTVTDSITINGTAVGANFSGTTLSDVISDINTAAIANITATNVGNALVITNTAGGKVEISGTGTALADLGLDTGSAPTATFELTFNNTLAGDSIVKLHTVDTWDM